MKEYTKCEDREANIHSVMVILGRYRLQSLVLFIITLKFHYDSDFKIVKYRSFKGNINVQVCNYILIGIFLLCWNLKSKSYLVKYGLLRFNKVLYKNFYVRI